MIQLAILDYGSFQVHADGRVIGIPGYCIRAGDRVILVDTGFPAVYMDDPEGAAAADELGSSGRVHLTAGGAAGGPVRGRVGRRSGPRPGQAPDAAGCRTWGSRDLQPRPGPVAQAAQSAGLA